MESQSHTDDEAHSAKVTSSLIGIICRVTV